MSALPVNWSLVDGLSLFELVRGVSYDKAAIRNEAAPGLVPVLRANNIQRGKLNRIDLVYVPERFITPHQMLRRGDLLIASSSGSKSVVGKAAPASSEFTDAAFGAFCTVLRPRMASVSDWLRYFVRTADYRAFVERVALGVNINNLRGSDLGAMLIPLAPLAAQRRTVAKLDTLMGRTERARTDLERVPLLAAQYRRAVLQKAYSGDLTADWRLEQSALPSPSALKQAVEACRREASSQHVPGRRRPTLDTETGRQPVALGVLPDSWVEMDLGSVTDPNRPIQYGILKPGDHQEDGVPYVKVMNVRGGRVELDKIRRTTPDIHAAYARSTLRHSDLLLTIRGTVGRIAEVPPELDGGNITQDTVRIALLPCVRRRYAYWYLHSPAAQEYFRANQKGVAVRGINVGDVRPMELPVCSLEEQDEIIRRVDRSMIEIDRLTFEATSARRLLDRLDEAILAKAFRGELIPQDPTDEPASLLLERVCAAKAATPGPRRGRKAVA